MTDAQKAEKAAGDARKELRALAVKEDSTSEDIEKATKELNDLETRAEALERAEPVKVEPIEDADAETRERRELRSKARVHRYIGASLEMRAVDGAEAEYAAAEGKAGSFPLKLLAPDVEVRATTDAKPAVTPGDWLDRVFASAAAGRVGVTMRSVPSGARSYPVTTAGATGEQQDRGETTDDAAWTVGITELKPKRGSVRAVFGDEDAARLGEDLEEALKRDLRMAVVDSIDKAIFKGDTGPNTAAYDIVGFQKAAISEFTLTQANKVKPTQTLAAFLALVDGLHAESLGDLGIVTSVGANVLWGSTVASAVENQTLAQFLRANGMSWGARYDIDTNTANGDFGAYVGLRRGIEGAAIAAVWESATMIRDPYSNAAKGEVALTLNYLWDFGIPVRPTSSDSSSSREGEIRDEQRGGSFLRS